MRSPSVTPPPARCKALRTHACGHARACGADANETRDCATRHRSHAPAYAQKGSCAHSPASQSASAAPGTHRPRPRAPLPLARALTQQTRNDEDGCVPLERSAPRLALAPDSPQFAARPSHAQAPDYVELGSDASIKRCPPSCRSRLRLLCPLSPIIFNGQRAVRNHELFYGDRRFSFEVKACIRCRPRRDLCSRFVSVERGD